MESSTSLPRSFADELAMNSPSPYLDVMTINTSQFPIPSSSKNIEPHSLLLVEPMSMPKINHTGLAPSMFPKNKTLYYPNGEKRITLREEIKNTIRARVYTKEAAKMTSVIKKTQRHRAPWNGNTTSSDCSTDAPQHSLVPTEITAASPHTNKSSYPQKPVNKNCGNFIGPIHRPTRRKQNYVKAKTVMKPQNNKYNKGKDENTRKLIQSIRETNHRMEVMGRIR